MVAACYHVAANGANDDTCGGMWGSGIRVVDRRAASQAYDVSVSSAPEPPPIIRSACETNCRMNATELKVSLPKINISCLGFHCLFSIVLVV